MTAPAFTLDSLSPSEGAMRQIQLSDSAGKVRLLNIINSLDRSTRNTSHEAVESNS